MRDEISMSVKKSIESALSSFKRVRSGLVDGDEADIEQHLHDFAKELASNSLLVGIKSELPSFDTTEWWEKSTASFSTRRRSVNLDFPADEEERLALFWDLTLSMASADKPPTASISQIGQLSGHYKHGDCVGAAQRLIFRPFVELLGDRIREKLDVLNPAVRELAGVPLNLVPREGTTKIFLSHKSADKDVVRRYADILEELGLEPWLDEKDMRAGDTIHREIAKGFETACAVVFFVTKNFKDERWLRREVNHAVNRQVNEGARFRIITLAFDGAEVPTSLTDQLFVHVTSDLQAVREILRALPIQVGPARWRESREGS